MSRKDSSHVNRLAYRRFASEPVSSWVLAASSQGSFMPLSFTATTEPTSVWSAVTRAPLSVRILPDGLTQAPADRVSPLESVT